MKFTGDIEQTVPPGLWNFIATPGTGSITVSYRPSGGSDTLLNTGDVTNGVISSTSTDDIRLPLCRLEASLTGDATFELYRAGK